VNDFDDEPVNSRPVAPRVLVADDNQLIRRITEALLLRCGALVSLAGNGIEALELLRQETFEVALLDIRMPFVGGLEIVSLVRASPEAYKCVPTFVGMSASPAEEQIQLCLQCGMSDYLCKPVSQSDLAKGLVRWCYLAQSSTLEGSKIERGHEDE